MESRIIEAPSLVQLEKMQNELLKSGKWDLFGSILISESDKYHERTYYRELVSKEVNQINIRLKSICEYFELLHDLLRDYFNYKRLKKGEKNNG